MKYHQTLYRLLIISSILILAWALPSSYYFATKSKQSIPFQYYSHALNDFLHVSSHEADQLIYKDTRDSLFTEKEVDALVPTFFYRQLVMEDRFPDSLFHQKVSPQIMARHNFFFSSHPRDENNVAPPLYPLLESLPKRVNLQMPTDVMRFTKDGVEFIDMTSNRINHEKSALFSKAFQSSTYTYPITVISGNPTSRKAYDEGYFFVDQDHHLFHLKAIHGQPYLKEIPLPRGLIIKHLYITEYEARNTYAFLTDQNNHFYVLSAPDYSLKATALPPLDPSKDDLFIMGDLFDWNVRCTTAQGVSNYAIDAKTYALKKTINTVYTSNTWEKLSPYIFPFQLQLTSRLNKVFKPQLVLFSWWALLLNGAWLILYIVLQKSNLLKKSRLETLLVSLTLLMGGLFAFIPLLIFRNT